jgi:hypothetical protein
VSELYFLGAVGMINSLRLAGHTERIVALDCGLTAAHRELLEGEVTIVDAPSGREPFTLKPYAALAHPSDLMVLIDTDMVVTRSLAPLLERAAEDGVVGFRNPVDRFVPEWGELLDLGELERRPDLCSGFVAAAYDPGYEVLELLEDRQRRVLFDRSYFGGREHEYALHFADQDVLNAVLSARVASERVELLDSDLAPMPPFDEVELLSIDPLRCTGRGGLEPFLIHQSMPWKPWNVPMYDGVYSRLLRRMLVGPDLAIRVPEAEVPRTLRDGVMGALSRRRVNAVEQVQWRVGGWAKERFGVELFKRDALG